ncbi:hypothetical protein KFK09_022689 [Dendrobium nobile]|uniref:Lycopene epsilon cyclase n=1 Tax=Dendrobium nobile TaxID=94219 RepID=A0A8T3AJE7_DENNO|nr:hypothetical protein KFK09_022689 [Dendrobium nobile]
MECLGRMRAAALSLPFCDWKCQRRLAAGKRWPLLRQRKRSIRLLPPFRAGGAMTEVKGVEEFADEEDYIKAGGSERFFVQMQERKPMEKQSKIADKLPMISSSDPLLELIVVGCGPAGMSLATEAAKSGLRVGLIGPDLPFTNNYGVWEDEFKGLGLEGCIEHVWQDTIAYLDSNDPILIGRAYGRVSRHLLHAELLRRLISNFQVGNNPYDPRTMVFMDYRDHVKGNMTSSDEEYPTFLYVMPMSSTRVFFEEWSYIPVGGSLPSTEQKNLAFGAAASMVHPATGYSIVRSLSEAPKYASVITNILKRNAYSRQIKIKGNVYNPSALAWRTLWPQERKRQRAFFLFGLALILQLDIDGIRIFFQTFFRLPDWMWQGFLGSTLSSVDLIWFSFYMFAIAPNSLRMCLIRHLLLDPTGSIMIREYLTL